MQGIQCGRITAQSGFVISRHGILEVHTIDVDDDADTTDSAVQTLCRRVCVVYMYMQNHMHM